MNILLDDAGWNERLAAVILIVGIIGDRYCILSG